MHTRTVALLVISVLGVLSGCELSAPRFQLVHATLGGNRVFVETETYTDVLEYHAVHRTRDLRRYLTSYPLTRADRLHAVGTSQVSLSNDLQATYASTRMLRLSHYEFGTAPISGQLIEIGSDGSSRVLRDWLWPRRDTNAPVAADNRGRYLVTLGNRIETLDTSDLRTIPNPDLTRMFDIAARLDPGAQSVYFLTENLNYLVVRLAERDSKGSNTFMAADGRSYLRGPDRGFGSSFYYAFIDRQTGSTGAFPDRFPPNDWHGLRSAFKGAGESKRGELLLLYFEYPPTERGLRYTIRDRNLATRFEVTVPLEKFSEGETAGPDVAWNPATHCVLFYDHRNLAQDTRLVTMHIWDYEAGSLRTISIDLAAEFQQDGDIYVPKPTHRANPH